MKIGTSDVSKIYLGASEISKAYLGTSEVYQNTPPIPQGGGIDEHTIACWHFDEGDNVNMTKSLDAARGIGPYGNGKTTTSSDCVKFGDSGLIEDSNGVYRVVHHGLGVNDDWTIDNWWYTGTNLKAYHIASSDISTSGYFSTTHGVLFDKANNRVALVDGYSTPSIISSVSYTFPENTMVHIATCRDITNGKTYAFVDGVKVLEVADTTQNPIDSPQLMLYGWTLKVDEVRMSDNVRWTSNFSVPTEAYSRNADFKQYFAVVGTPTITDRVASGFSNSNYLMTGNFINKTTSSFEVGTCIKPNQILSDGINYGIIDSGLKYRNEAGSYSYSRNIRLTLYNDKIRFRANSGPNTSFVDITGTTSITTNSKVYIKATFDTTNGYKLYTSTDKSTWILEGSNASTTLPDILCQSSIAIGTNSDTGYNYPLNGSLYLDETYIKVDGNVVWKPYVE